MTRGLLLGLFLAFAQPGQLLAQSAPTSKEEFLVAYRAWRAGDFALAMRLFTDLAQQGDPQGYHYLGHLYARGFKLGGVEPRDMVLAYDNWKVAADKGIADAQNDIGELLLMRSDELGRKRADAMAEMCGWFRKAADQGFAQAQYNLGASLQHDERCGENEVEAMKYFKLAAAQGSQKAKDAIQRWEADRPNAQPPTVATPESQSGRDSIRKSKMESQAAAEQYESAVQLSEGPEEQRDYPKAEQLFLKAMAAGAPYAWFKLAALYYSPHPGLPANYSAAARLLEAPRDSSHTDRDILVRADANIMLGVMYLYGRGVAANPTYAKKLFYREFINVSVNAGPAKYWAGLMAENGIDQKVDLTWAVALYCSSQIHDLSAAALRRLGKECQ